MSQGPFDPSKLMEQARELQDKLARIQQDLRLRTVEVTVGGGMVSCEMNGQLEVTKIAIDPQAVDPRDVEMLQDLIAAAVNQAAQRARSMAQEEMQKVTGLPLGSMLGGLGS